MNDANDANDADPAAEATAETVAALLAAQGLHVPPEDLQALVAVYPAVRRRMARVHAVPAGDRVPWSAP